MALPALAEKRMLRYSWLDPLLAAMAESEPLELCLKVDKAEAVLTSRLDALSLNRANLEERYALNEGLFALRILRRTSRAD
jgi:hypothetical protein